MKIVRLEDFKQFSPEKMKKNNLFQTPRFFCDVYGFEPGQAQKGHVHGESIQSTSNLTPCASGSVRP